MRADERQGERTGSRYDTDLIKEECERLLAAYLGRPGKVSGSRMVWDCPKCGKPKLSLQRVKGSVGCLNAGCEVETNTDVIGVIASLEGLQTRGEDFKRVCALSYELLAIPDPGSDAGRRGGSPNGHDGHDARAAARSSVRTLAPRPPEPEVFEPAAPDVVDDVLSRLLQLCPLEGRDVGFLASRGVAEQTARFGRFGSITGRRARHAMGVLDREFPREQLRGVPGFREREADRDGGGGDLGFTLWGDFLLIPYLDPTGRVVTLEGRAVGEVPGWAGKYTSLRNGGNHLYVFPGFDVNELVAFCEGPMGAIVAAQEGLAVGAIQGVKRYTKAGSAPGGEEPLPEIVRADFRGRTVLYVPDLDVKPDARADVEQHATRACDFLVSRQNGRPLIATVPQDGTGGPTKDLDAWILSAPEAGLYGVLSRLLKRAHPPEAWPGLPDPAGATPGPVVVSSDARSDAPDHAATGRPASPSPAPLPPPEDEGQERTTEMPAAEPQHVAPAAGPAAEGGRDGAEERDETAAFDAYDRWHALLGGSPGAAELAFRPEPYRPGGGAGPAPEDGFALETELQWTGLFALGAALVFWYYVGASEGWLAGGVGFLPSLPGPLTVAAGLPFALVFGAAAGSILLLHARGRRTALRRHLLGPERQGDSR